MKRSLILVLAALLAVAVAIPASAATLTLGGALQGQWVYNKDATFGMSQDWLRLRLNFTLKEGDFTAGLAQFNLNISGTVTGLSLHEVWYGAWNSKPIAFWVSNNHANNAYKFASLADPLGTAVRMPIDTTLPWVARAHGELFGTTVNAYAGNVANAPNTTTGFVARTTTPIGKDLTLGTVVTYQDNYQAPPVTPIDYLTLGVDLAGKIPGVGGKFNAAAAGSLDKTGSGNWQPTASGTDYFAYTAGVADVAVGPVTGYAKVTGVGPNFEAKFKSTSSSALLNKYAGKSAVEAGVKGQVELGLPLTVGLDNALWLDFDFNPVLYNETTAWATVKPIGSLAVTGKVAYMYDAPAPPVPAYTGFKLIAAVSGSPVKGLTLTADTSYVLNTNTLDHKSWGSYVQDFAPGVVEKATLTLAGVFDMTGMTPVTPTFYGFGGLVFTVNPALSGRVGVLTKDQAGKLVGAADVTYKLSEQITLLGNYTYREVASAMQNYVYAAVRSTVGRSTFTAAYGQTGLGAAPAAGSFEDGKPWAYLYSTPTPSTPTAFDKDRFTFTMSVPF